MTEPPSSIETEPSQLTLSNDATNTDNQQHWQYSLFGLILFDETTKLHHQILLFGCCVFDLLVSFGLDFVLIPWSEIHLITIFALASVLRVAGFFALLSGRIVTNNLLEKSLIILIFTSMLLVVLLSFIQISREPTILLLLLVGSVLPFALESIIYYHAILTIDVNFWILKDSISESTETERAPLIPGDGCEDVESGVLISQNEPQIQNYGSTTLQRSLSESNRLLTANLIEVPINESVSSLNFVNSLSPITPIFPVSSPPLQKKSDLFSTSPSNQKNDVSIYTAELKEAMYIMWKNTDLRNNRQQSGLDSAETLLLDQKNLGNPRVSLLLAQIDFIKFCLTRRDEDFKRSNFAFKDAAKVAYDQLLMIKKENIQNSNIDLFEADAEICLATATFFRGIIFILTNRDIKGAYEIRKSWAKFQLLSKKFGFSFDSSSQFSSNIPHGNSDFDILIDSIILGINGIQLLAYVANIPNSYITTLRSLGTSYNRDIVENRLWNLFNGNSVLSPLAGILFLMANIPKRYSRSNNETIKIFQRFDGPVFQLLWTFYSVSPPPQPSAPCDPRFFALVFRQAIVFSLLGDWNRVYSTLIPSWQWFYNNNDAHSQFLQTFSRRSSTKTYVRSMNLGLFDSDDEKNQISTRSFDLLSEPSRNETQFENYARRIPGFTDIVPEIAIMLVGCMKTMELDSSGNHIEHENLFQDIYNYLNNTLSKT
ncbi:hypothetical protein HK096_000627, partial [Nowakowskiella sp. JEL0078]